MSTKTRDECIQLIFNQLRIMGLVPGAHSPYAKQLHLFLNISRVFHLFFAVSFIAMNPHDIVLMADGVRTIANHLQGTKALTFFNEKKMLQMIKDMNQFWYSEDVEKVYKLCKIVIKSFTTLVYMLYFAVVLTPTLTGHHPFPAAYPEFPGGFVIISVLFHFQIILDVTATIAVESFFFMTTCFLYAQFKMLNKRMEMLGSNPEQMYKEAINCVKYHNFLLEYVEQIIQMFSMALLVQYGISTISVCTELYVFDKQDIIDKCITVVFVFGLLFQLALYCFPADLVADEALETCDIAFGSQWYRHPQVAKEYVLLIIQRAQKRLVFTAGGLVEINRTAFTTICKWAMSIYMFMRDVEDASK